MGLKREGLRKYWRTPFWLVIQALVAVMFICDVPLAYAEAGRFEDYEIRVIRPRFMQKRHRFELGGELVSIVNDTFVYTLMASGLLTYHFTENWAVEGGVYIGYSFDRSEKTILHDDFEIKTKVFRTQYIAEGNVIWTPAYGKVQLPEGRLIYFDTFLAAGAGMTGVEWRYSDFCQSDVQLTEESSRQNELKSGSSTNTYPNFTFGAGQKIYRSYTSSLRWDLRWRPVFFNATDADCDPSATGTSTATQNLITLQIGASKFF